MKIKEIKRTANVAWSPKQQQPIYLAAGTAAQQLDATFNTSAALEIYHVDLASKDLDMPVAGSLPSDHRFHKLIWTDCQFGSEQHSKGFICAGTDSGEVCIFDASAILAGNHDEVTVHTLSEHHGPVQAMDINKFQNNLLATGASDSEIFIWDLNNPVTSLTPGAKTAPPDQISCLAWNHQVQHILGSSSQTGRVVVWDLRKSEPIIKVGDQSAMFHYKSMAWHPDVATQMLIGNEDDRYPVIQMWDLRFATSPMKVFEGHTRGILSLAWCPQDSDLLMSCGKDNRILCWNPNTQAPSGEIVYELPTTAQWSSDVSWCPRNPGLISTTAFDGHITISTLMGGSQQIIEQQNNQISDSFGIQQSSFQAPQSPAAPAIIEPLKKPPKWMRKPCGARFSFGGRLVSFGNFNEPGVPKQVHISQVVTETNFLKKSHELENALLASQLLEYCDMKISLEENPSEKLLWQFLKSNFHGEPRLQFLDLLGYNPQELSQKISDAANGGQTSVVNSSLGVNAGELAMKMEKLKTEEQGHSLENDLLASETSSPFAGEKTPGADNGSALFDAIAAGSVSQENIEEDETVEVIEPFSISTTDDTDGLICQALLTGNFEAAVDVCFNDSRMADGLLLAIAGGPDLFARTQKLYLAKAQSAVSKVISAVVNRDWRSIVEHTVIENWKESLSMLVTYSKAEEFSELCCILGDRLENEVEDYTSAMLCYICAGNVERMVSCWSKSKEGHEPSPAVLQSLVEKIMVLKKSVEADNYQNVASGNLHTSEQLCNYANLLSSQGNLQTAMVYLSTVDDSAVNVLKDRVFYAHGNLQMHPPERPFQKVDIRSQQYNRQPQQKAAPSSYGSQQNVPQYSPGGPNTPSSFYNPASNVPNPSSIGQSSSNYNTMSNQANMYNPSSIPPTMMGSHYSNPPANIPPPQKPNAMFTPPLPSPGQNLPPTHSMYNPSSYNMSNPSIAGSHTNTPNQLPPTMFNPPTDGGFVQSQGLPSNQSAPSMLNQGHPPLAGMMKPNVPQDFTPPPPVSGALPMSMKAAKEASPLQNAPPQPMNFYNPAEVMQQQSIPGNMPGHMQTQGSVYGQVSGQMTGQISGHMQLPGQIPAQTPGQMPSAGMVPPRSSTQPHSHLSHQSSMKELETKPEVIKGPIPAEHMVLQETFDAMLDRCRNASNNPQTKRKIEDVRRKLDILYDLLRENKVSANVLNGLHQMSQACQSRDYMVGIQIHTHMITTGNFSEISSYMPGLKTLMQISGQLKI